ncbi:hypothetical protein [Lutimonas sp.]|uniref:hypothetical protein n=1 Tax=Lutimonas sp. TaxID=1872403 RepID=UPI003D9B4022
MKKLMTVLLLGIPFGILAQGTQDSHADADDIFNMSYADASNVESNEINKTRIHANAVDNAVYVSKEDLMTVKDSWLDNPGFDIQENMIAYTKDQKTVFFSANKKLKTKSVDESNLKIKKSVQLQLFKADVTESGDWVNLEMLPFNGKKHSTGHPSLSSDDTKLYFVSDGPESTGKTDIFVVELLEEGNYGTPSNMGPKINTSEIEIFPYVDESDVLYFASDKDTEGDEFDVFASQVVDDVPMAAVKIDVDLNASKEDYVAAFNAIDADVIMTAEKAANLRDLEILLEAENLAAIKQIENDLSKDLDGAAYDFSSETVSYTVQIGAFQKNVKTGTYDTSSGLFNQRYDDGYNRFYSGVFSSQAEAQKHLDEMKQKGYKDAFVLGLKGQERFLPE